MDRLDARPRKRAWRNHPSRQRDVSRSGRDHDGNSRSRPSYDRVHDAQQYVSTLSGGRPETFGSRYVFAYIERSTFATEFRMGFTLKPDLNLDVYAEPFASSGRYYDYGELLSLPASSD